MSELGIGKLVTTEQGRDAIHVAILPMLAVSELRPGQHLANGIVDPFLKAPVRPGERYWLFLYPSTVTSLRHVWTHPAFGDESPPVAEAPLHRSFDALPVPPKETR